MDNLEKLITTWQEFDFHNFLNNCKDSDIKNTLKKDSLNILDFLTLLSDAADNFLEDIAQKAHKMTIREFGKTIQIYTPLYLSNHCKNRCIYCGFNTSNNIIRSKLTDDQILNEAKKITELGIKHILLLTGGDRENSSFKYIKNAIKITKPFFDSISIEVYSMNLEEYKELIDLGVDNITIYQETYSKNRYSQVHLGGEKRNFKFRLEAPDRAAKAGANSVNLGALLGLYKRPIEDFFMAVVHSEYIKNKYPSCDIGISLPRIKEAAVNFVPESPVGDLLLSKMIMAYRLFIPRGSISISTRESAMLRDNLLPLGVTKMSAESKTTVGGHSQKKSDPQFQISDQRSVKDLDSHLVKMGYQPIYKDWVRV